MLKNLIKSPSKEFIHNDLHIKITTINSLQQVNFKIDDLKSNIGWFATFDEKNQLVYLTGKNNDDLEGFTLFFPYFSNEFFVHKDHNSSLISELGFSNSGTLKSCKFPNLNLEVELQC